VTQPLSLFDPDLKRVTLNLVEMMRDRLRRGRRLTRDAVDRADVFWLGPIRGAVNRTDTDRLFTVRYERPARPPSPPTQLEPWQSAMGALSLR
jgi:hypothetical protein